MITAADSKSNKRFTDDVIALTFGLEDAIAALKNIRTTVAD